MDSTVKQLNIQVTSEGLDETISKVKELGDSVSNLSSKKATKSVSVAQTKSEARSTKQTSSNLRKSASSLSKILISLISIRKLTNFFKSSFEESSSWIENLNLFEVALGDATDKGLEFTKTMSEAFGLDQNQLIEYMGLFNQMATAIGNSTDIAYKMSEALTALGLDISSLYNISVESAMSKLRSGIAGQVKPVRELGLDITAQSLDKYLKEDLGLDITSKALSQSQKQLLRTIMLIQQTNNAWGDLSKTINTFSNQQKILSAQITQLKRAFGDLFIGTTEQAGIATKAIYYINGVLMALVEIIRTFIPEATTSGFNNVNDNIEDTTESIEDLEEEVNNSLLSFDKFNTISNNDAKGSDWLSDLLEQGFLDEYNNYMEKFNVSMLGIENKATEIKEQILGWLGYIKEVNEETGEIKWVSGDSEFKSSLREVLPIIKDFFKTVIPILIETSKEILPLILQHMKETLPYIKDLLSSILPLISDIVELIYPLFTELFKKFLPQTMKNLQIFVDILSWVLKLLNGILNVIEKLTSAETWKNIGQRILNFFRAIETVIQSIAKIIVEPFKRIGNLFSGNFSYNIGLQGFANGGYPDTGQLFIANEAGAELVGNIGGRTAVANNDMIVQAIENASYRGISRAMGNGTNNNLSISFRDVNANDLSRALSQSMIKEFQRQGYKVSKA